MSSFYLDSSALAKRSMREVGTPWIMALLVRLSDQGVITSSWATQAMGLSRREFLDVLGQYGVSEFDDQMDVRAEAAHA